MNLSMHFGVTNEVGCSGGDLIYTLELSIFDKEMVEGFRARLTAFEAMMGWKIPIQGTSSRSSAA